MSLFSAIVIHIGVALYTAAWVLRGILDLAPDATILGIDALMFFIIALGVLTGIYTMLGRPARGGVDGEHPDRAAAGRRGLHHRGGLCEDRRLVGAGADAGDAIRIRWPGAEGFPATTGNFLNMARGASDPSGLPWYSILLGYPVLGIWYWCCDQTIVQRVLAARDEKQARLGPLFCAFIKILPVFLFVLPGVICVALVQQGAFDGAAPGEGRRHLYLHARALAAGGVEGPGRRGHAGGRHADLLGGAELRGNALRLRYRQALAARPRATTGWWSSAKSPPSWPRSSPL